MIDLEILVQLDIFGVVEPMLELGQKQANYWAYSFSALCIVYLPQLEKSDDRLGENQG
jgi:hypothetical protein